MALAQERIYTIDDIYALPEGKIADYIEQNNGSCEVDLAPFAVFLNGNDRIIQ